VVLVVVVGVVVEAGFPVVCWITGVAVVVVVPGVVVPEIGAPLEDPPLTRTKPLPVPLTDPMDPPGCTNNCPAKLKEPGCSCCCKYPVGIISVLSFQKKAATCNGGLLLNQSTV
jgi:hypothetical protein